MNISVTVKDLLDAGVHFGHQTKRWNPRSKPYVFDHRQGISIIDLGKTHAALEQACNYLEETVGNGGNVLFVGTKKQARDIVREAATACNMPYCVDRWLGGTLTNFETVKRSIAKYKRYQQMEVNGEMDKLPAKEVAAIKREMGRMQRNFSGIVEMDELPSALFVVDVNHEKIAVAEGVRCSVPTIGIVDTNSDPTALNYPIPGNDDAVKSIRIMVETILEAVQSGLSQRDSRRSNRAQADLRAVVAAESAPQAPGTDEEDDSSTEEEDSEPKVPAKRIARARKAPVKAE